MDPAAPDEDLMLAYGRGDHAAFDQLYARHRGGLYRFLLRGAGQRASAEELYQEAWARVIAARARWRPEAKFATWLYQIAHNLLVDHYRRQRHGSRGEDDEARLALLADESQPGPEAALSAFQQRRGLQRAIEALPDEQRVALLLRLERELSLEEIGEITGAGRETVKSRLRYAMDKLRATVAS